MTTTDPAATPEPTSELSVPVEIRAVPVRRPGRILVAVIIVILAAALIRSVATNPRFDWSSVGKYLFSDPIMDGLVRTIELTAISMVIGIIIGVILAVMRLSPNPLVVGASGFYIWLFRGTPVLVQLLFWSFIGALYPVIALGVPFGPSLLELNSNHLITPFVAALLGLGLNEGAYMSEIVRAGLLSVDEGQTEASKALGMRRILMMRRIILPQAMRVIIPPTGNETIGMLKTTSLVSVIAYTELLYAAQLIYAANYKQIPLLIVASIWYLVLTTILSIAQYFIERHYGRGTARATPPTLIARIWQSFSTWRHTQVETAAPTRHGL
ncbi:MAG: amino acid ABC transporter permease [Actinomycetota bacterium]